MERLLRHPWLVLAALTVATLAVGHRAPLLVQDNSPETFLATDEAGHAVYQQLVRAFGSDELVLVQLRGARLQRAADLRALARLAGRVARIRGVQSTASVTDLLSADALAEGPDAEELAALERQVSAQSFYGELGLWRPGARALGLLVNVVMRGPRSRVDFAAALAAATRPLEAAGHEVLVAGLTPANAAIDRQTRRTLPIFLPLTALLSLLIGLALFRSPGALLAMAAPVGGAVAVGAGALQLLGEPINIVTGVMPPLVLSIGCAGAVHLVSRYAGCMAEGDTAADAVRRTMREKLMPTAFAFVTTAVGFGSLALSGVHSVRVLGLVTALSLLAALVLVTQGTPALLLLLRPRIHAPAHRRALLQRLAHVALQRRPLVLVLALLLFAPAVSGLLLLRASIDGMELLPDGAPEKRAFRQLEAEGLGLNAVDIWIRQPTKDHAALLAGARQLSRLARELERQPGVTGSVGVHDLLAGFQLRSTGRTGLPDSLLALELMEPEDRAKLERSLALFWSRAHGLKLTLLTIPTDEARVRALSARIRAKATRLFPGARVEVSGHFMMLITTAGSLMRTLQRSLALSVAVIGLLFLIAFRSPGLALAGLACSLLPVLGALGLMGWLGIPMDIATVMTGSVAFGVAVDDVFHYLHHKKQGGVLRAACVAGQGIVATSLMIAGGFVVLAASGFAPLIRFGLLTAGAVLAALAVAAVLLPALVGRKADLKHQPCDGG